MEVLHDKKYQQFTISLEDDEAELAYAIPTPEVIVFTHTYVPESARGKGVATQLIKAGFRFAEENKLRVVPDCDAVKIFMKRHPEYERLMH